MPVERSPSPEERRKVEERLESLLGPIWWDAPMEETVDVLARQWPQLRHDFARLAPTYPSYPIIELHDVHARLQNAVPEEQRMVQAILEVVVGNTSEESLPSVAPERHEEELHRHIAERYGDRDEETVDA